MIFIFVICKHENKKNLGLIADIMEGVERL